MRACVRAGVHGSRIILCKSREHPRYLDDCRCGRASLKLAERDDYINKSLILIVVFALIYTLDLSVELKALTSYL